MSNDPSCLFCKIVSKQIPSSFILESDEAIVIQDIQPQAPKHFLVIPKKHLASLNDFNDPDRDQFLPELFRLADELSKKQGFRDAGYRTVINNQKLSGQTVFHLHMHVLAGASLGHFGT